MADVNTRIAHDGYGMLELNQVAFRRDGRIEAQCFLDTTDFSAAAPAENGMLLVADQTSRKVFLPDAETDAVLLNYTAEHIYDERTPQLKSFALVPGRELPRLGYLSTGDKFTTNTVSFPKGDTYASEAAFWTAVAACGTTPMYGHASTDGTILVNATATNAKLKVVCGTTMPDGQKAIKFIAL